MRGIIIVFITASLILSCGCMMLMDEATGVWKKEPFSTDERMTIKTDGTFLICDSNGNEINSGTWSKTGDDYEFIPENGTDYLYAKIYPGRAQLFLTFDNATYVKI